MVDGKKVNWAEVVMKFNNNRYIIIIVMKEKQTISMINKKIHKKDKLLLNHAF